MKTPLRVAVTLTVVALAVLAGYRLWQHYLIAPWTRDARFQADVVTLAADVSGAVVDLRVRDNQHVAKGEVLMVIDPERYQAVLDQARAVAQVRAQELRLHEHEAERRARLGQSISAEQRENAQIAAAISRAQLRQAEAAVRAAELDLARTQVVAPQAGQVTNLRLVQGNHVSAGDPVMALVVDDSFYVQAYFEETKLPAIQLGDPVQVWPMSTGEPLRGEVEGVSLAIADPTAGAGDRLLASVDPAFDWVRLAQRIPVRIRLLERPESLRLTAGMTASVKVLEAR